jgi:hypothetical protein
VDNLFVLLQVPYPTGLVQVGIKLFKINRAIKLAY